MSNPVIDQQLFANVLAQHSILFSVSTHWLCVGKGYFNGKWILFLSTKVEMGEQLLKKVIPFLIWNNVSFRIAKSTAVLAAINQGKCGEQEKGKFITIYSRSMEQASWLAHQLRELTDSCEGPIIPAAIQIGAVLYVSYATLVNNKIHMGIPEPILIPFKAGKYLVRFDEAPKAANKE